MTTIAPVSSQTIGQKLDAEIAAIKAGTHSAVVDVETFGSKLKSWLAEHIADLGGYAGIIAAVKHWF